MDKVYKIIITIVYNLQRPVITKIDVTHMHMLNIIFILIFIDYKKNDSDNTQQFKKGKNDNFYIMDKI